MRFLLAISLLLAFSSCSDLNKSAQIERLEKMEETIDTSTGLLNDNKIENASEMLSVSEEYVDKIKGLEDDTIQLEFAYKLDRFKKMYDDLTPALTHFEELLETVHLEKEALNKLKGDINHAYGKRHKYDDYLSFEEKKVAELESEITMYVERKEVITEVYDELHLEIEEFLIERFAVELVQ
ncbi:MAG: hypothetical protein HRT57_03020 [Crocinitomicaceae bacterium]|nr:hypothetical protein [Crocinitomicaceae bacterium]